MAIRAVILAVEDYAKTGAGGLSPKLEGTLNDATSFRDWLLNKKGVLSANMTFCPNPTKAEIATAFRNLVDAGHDATEELYVFYSGHGFTFTDSPMNRKPADIIVGSEFENVRDSGDACLKLPEIQYALYQYMGPGNHFYFIDACRNQVRAIDVNPGVMGWRRDLSQLGQPSVFTLYSTERGNFAIVKSAFAPALVNGLGGRGRSKRRDGFSMWVSFDSLRAYLESTLPQRIDTDPGSGPGRILEIKPIPQYTCVVKVRNAAANDQFNLTLKDAYSRAIGQPVGFAGVETTIVQPPDDYLVAVTGQQCIVKPVGPVPADLYDDCALEFEKAPQAVAPGTAPPPPSLAPTVSLSVTGPPNTAVEVTNLNTGEVFPIAQQFSKALPPGSYKVRALESGWTAVREELVGIIAGKRDIKLDIASRTPSPLRDALLSKTTGAHDAATVDFSESLGPMANEDLGLWLSIMGASRILGPDGFYKLSGLPLKRFDDVTKDSCPLYVLIGVENAKDVVSVAVRKPGAVDVPMATMNTVAGVPGLFEKRADLGPGLQVLHLQIGDGSPLATVTYCLPNRATLITVAVDEDGKALIHQFMLPLPSLLQYLTHDEQLNQPHNQLDAIRFTTLAQKKLARRRSPKPQAQEATGYDPKLIEDQSRWVDLLHGKWMDPVMAIMASYEILRNERDPIDPYFTSVVLGNLRRTFPSIPDVEILAKLAGVPHTEPTTTPLFLTGVQALKEPEKILPFPPSNLDYTGPWVTWVGLGRR